VSARACCEGPGTARARVQLLSTRPPHVSPHPLRSCEKRSFRIGAGSCGPAAASPKRTAEVERTRACWRCNATVGERKYRRITDPHERVPTRRAAAPGPLAPPTSAARGLAARPTDQLAAPPGAAASWGRVLYQRIRAFVTLTSNRANGRACAGRARPCMAMRGHASHTRARRGTARRARAALRAARHAARLPAAALQRCCDTGRTRWSATRARYLTALPAGWRGDLW